jgi:large subunit ribosomal protein L32
MALPKRKHSKARRDKSRTHWKLAVASITKCPQCAEPILPHRACMKCGYYRGRQTIVVREKTEKAAAKAS